MTAGRPKIEIDNNVFEEALRLQCTKSEIASLFRCSDDTIENYCKREYKENFSAVYKKIGECGKISLRRAQFRMAENNPTMAVWLGKQYLGQKDYPQELAVLADPITVNISLADCSKEVNNDS